MPRGSALGMVTQLPSNDETSVSKRQLLARLDVCMGGRVAEEIIFGQDHITTGASSDLHTATELAHYMVFLFLLLCKNSYFSNPVFIPLKSIDVNTLKFLLINFICSLDSFAKFSVNAVVC